MSEGETERARFPAVLVITESVDPSRGGQERSVGEGLRALVRRGVPVTLATATPPSGIVPDHVQLVPEGRTATTRLRSFLDQAEDLAGRKRRGAVVLSMVPLLSAHAYLPRSGVHREGYRRSARSRPTAAGRLLAAAGSLWAPKRRLMIQRERAVLTGSTGPIVVAISSYVAEQVVRHYRTPAERIRVVRNGVDTEALLAQSPGRREARKRLGLSEGMLVLAAASHNFQRQGLHALRRALDRLPEDVDWTLLVAGPGQLEPHSRLRQLGKVSSAAVLLAAADVLVHPTFFDPASRIVLEALALGRPVITTRWNGAADFVGSAGIVVERPEDAEELAGAIRTLFDPVARQRAAAATAGLREVVSVERHLDELLALFQELRFAVTAEEP